MFDTHCHLNFKVFEGAVDNIISEAKKAGVNYFIVPGTDVESSKKAIEIAEKYNKVYAAVGIHPHHIFKFKTPAFVKTSAGKQNLIVKTKIQTIKQLLTHPKVVAIGEVGIDRYYYQKTKYQNYQPDKEFIEQQKELLKAQIELAIKYDKSLILHNREAVTDLLEVISEPAVAEALAGKAVFHCCEPDERLLVFAKKHKFFIGVDGDVTYWKEKQEFIKKIPLEILVLETDSPFLLPEPLRLNRLYPNTPANIPLIAQSIANIKKIKLNRLIDQTDKNAKKLLKIN